MEIVESGAPAMDDLDWLDLRAPRSPVAAVAAVASEDEPELPLVPATPVATPMRRRGSASSLASGSSPGVRLNTPIRRTSVEHLYAAAMMRAAKARRAQEKFRQEALVLVQRARVTVNEHGVMPRNLQLATRG